MTHPDGGSGTGPSGPAGPGPRAEAADRATAHFGTAYDGVMTRLGDAIAGGDQVARADARTSVADLDAAAFLRGGASVDDLDRNGWPLKARFPRP